MKVFAYITLTLVTAALFITCGYCIYTERYLPALLLFVLASMAAAHTDNVNP